MMLTTRCKQTAAGRDITLLSCHKDTALIVM